MDLNLEVKKLNLEELKNVYETYMMKDFPANELKPFQMIAEKYKEGCYEALGVMKNNEIIGYACFVKLGNDYLFDYLGVREDIRNKGIGSQFLQVIKEYYKDADSIIGEVEDYTLSDGDERELRERRYHFYLRNGLVDTGVKVWMYGVDYIILMVGNENEYDAEQLKNKIKALYLAHYQNMLPENLFLTKVRVKE